MKLTLLLSLLLGGCQSAPPPTAWTTQVVLELPTKFGGLTIGDLLVEPGNELAAVAGDGSVHVAWAEVDEGASVRWHASEVARFAGEMIQVATGDLDGRTGDELVVVGMESGTEDEGGRGAAYLISREQGTWSSELLFLDDALLHGACISDLDPDRPGNEVLVVGFSLRATLLTRDAQGSWHAETVAELPGPGKNALAYAGGAVIACSDGTLVRLVKEDGAWVATALERAPAGQARLGTDGRRLIASRDDGVLSLFEGPDSTAQVLYRADDKLRGAVLIEADPDSAGLEAATGGYTQQVVLLSRLGSEWKPRTLFEDEARLHHVIGGEVGTLGPALFACGYSGRVTALWPQRGHE